MLLPLPPLLEEIEQQPVEFPSKQCSQVVSLGIGLPDLSTYLCQGWLSGSDGSVDTCKQFSKRPNNKFGSLTRHGQVRQPGRL